MRRNSLYEEILLYKDDEEEHFLKKNLDIFILTLQCQTHIKRQDLEFISMYEPDKFKDILKEYYHPNITDYEIRPRYEGEGKSEH